MMKTKLSLLIAALCILCVEANFAGQIERVDVTKSVGNSSFITIQRGDKMLHVPEDLQRKLQEEDIWHLTPWLRTRIEVLEDQIREACATSDSVESFPNGLFDEEQLRKGAFILYLLFGIYAFTLLAIVCNDYFIPCVELICEDLKIPENVAAATFMSVATSCPEFFVNLISTFLTESDMGIGTIVGSAIFNALGVAAIGSLAAIRPITIEKKPVTRDALIYIFNVSVLVGIVWDGQVDWYEGLALGLIYILYFVVMFNSVRMFNLYDKIVLKCCRRNVAEITAATLENETHKEEPVLGIDNKAYKNDEPAFIMDTEKVEKVGVVDDDDSIAAQKSGVWVFPRHKSVIYKMWWMITWPLRFVLSMTIPSPVLYRRFYPLAFIMCIIWIGVNSYFVSWSMTVIGHTFMIPDSVMGMTFLAFGGCLPEACSIYIMSRQGKGGIGVSNALGANSLAILFALGVPWLIKTLTLLVEGAETPVVYINSTGIDVVVGSLVLAVIALWSTLFFAKFTLRKVVGFVLLALYAGFITFAVLTEMGYIFDRATATC